LLSGCVGWGTREDGGGNDGEERRYIDEPLRKK
jgi:hypothetical protein